MSAKSVQGRVPLAAFLSPVAVAAQPQGTIIKQRIKAQMPDARKKVERLRERFEEIPRWSPGKSESGK